MEVILTPSNLYVPNTTCPRTKYIRKGCLIENLLLNTVTHIPKPHLGLLEGGGNKGDSSPSQEGGGGVPCHVQLQREIARKLIGSEFSGLSPGDNPSLGHSRVTGGCGPSLPLAKMGEECTKFIQQFEYE